MTNALDQIGQRTAVRTPQTIGQATAVEQARAVAEVAAAVQVARQFPRELDTVRAEMQAACTSYALARRAFYAVRNRGEGPSVHLARELARIWGNFQSGVHELRRDDAAGESEVQAFAWDVQANTRSTRTFISPHARMKDGKRMPLIDLQDIYLSNQNTGARAVRECIFAALPEWLVAEAQQLCRQTLEAGPGGKSIEQRRQEAVAAFARGNVTEQQLVARVGKPVAQWTAQDVASLEVLFDSLRNGETTREEAFGEQQRVTAAEITGAGPAGPPPPPGDVGVPPVSRQQLTALHAGLTALGYTDRAERLAFLSKELGRELESTTDLTRNEASGLIDRIQQREVPAAASDEPGEDWVPEPPEDWQPEDGAR
ncbi:hypothetical protein QOZ88_05795 [Blastococcus sp. BMG 814]|uniref:Uncharacterized protein n=1 Tax=Blastococcus carthaginiensis TaxID=3050034 RepID=A0ABT9IA80_9ACTN|nr:hypothetical protein [Blastococcus carthaginiensis]MDP5182142.1 hypothetical protein [Blastococcus carthaginiensis]